MKLKISNNYKLFLILIPFILLGIGFFATALNTQSTGYKSSLGTETVVNVHSDCHEVDNNSSNNYFVPTRTLLEWQSFQNNLPNNVILTPYGMTCDPAVCQDGIVQCNGDCGQITTPSDDPICGTIDCDGRNYYTQIGLDSPSGTNYCRYSDYADITNNRCEGSAGFGNCKDANSSDCVDFSNSTQATAGICQYIGGCSGSTPGSTVDYPYGTSSGLCQICNGSGSILPASDDSSCGTIDCDGMDYYTQIGSDSPTGTNYCRHSDYADITSSRCEGINDCKDANTTDCTNYTNITSATAGICQYISGCSGSTPGSAVNYSNGTYCATHKSCISGSCITTDCFYDGSWTSNGGTDWTGCIGGPTNDQYRCVNGTWTGPINSVSCCTTHSYTACSGGDVYYFDSCGNKENIADNCASYEICQGNSCVCNDVCYSCQGGIDYVNACGTTCPCGSTPYLFTNIAGNNYIENDVMATFWDVDYEKAKEMYEETPLNDYGFSNNKYRSTDNYILANKPSTEENKIKLHIKEIEPEESHIDQIKLSRVLYDKNTDLIVDNQANILKSIRKQEVKDALRSCLFTNTEGDKKECLAEIDENDNNNIYGNKGDVIEAKIDVKNLKGKEVYLTMNSWGSTPLPLSPRAMKASSEASMSVFFDVDNNGEYTELNQIHPRELETTAHLDISDIIAIAKGDTVGLKIVWTQEHWVDQISVVTSEELEYRLEELAITKATHSIDGDVLSEVLEKDQVYSNTKQGDEIDLEFVAGRYEIKENEKEAYVFISSGFYNALRPELYPSLEIDYDWQDRIDEYVEELNNLK